MSLQPSVMQVVILRDGLLVGTEVFVPGSYSVGTAPQCELRLDDPLVDPLHAVLYFQNGRTAVQDNTSRGGLYVNGHRVNACEVRPQDEILIGPFVLKTRVVTKQPAVQKPAPSPEVAALLAGAPPPAAPPPAAPRVAPQGHGSAGSSGPTIPSVRVAPPPAPAVPPRVAPVAQVARPPDPATQVSSRRAAALAAAPHLRPVEQTPLDAADLPTEAVTLPPELVHEPQTVSYGDKLTVPGTPTPQLLKDAQPRAKRTLSAPRLAQAGKGAPRLYFELYWGEARRDARSFGPTKPKKPVVASGSENALLPLWGFSLPEDDFVIAESSGDSFRVYVPPGSVVEKQGAGADAFYPVAPRDLEVVEGRRRCLTLSQGMAARFSEGEMSLVAYVAPPPERLRSNPLKGLPWLAIANFVLLAAGFLSFLIFGPKPRELPDFTAKNLPPVAVKLMLPEPEKKEKAKKALQKIKERAKKKEKAPVAKKPRRTEKPTPTRPPPPESKAMKALAKLSAAGPATKNMLAAIDKLGSGPGSKNSRNNFKLSGLVGKAPIANAGLGTFGLGGGGKGGRGTKGREILHGTGGGGIGALAGAGFGKRGRVGGTVTRAATRKVRAQGNIDRERVAKVINSHLQEIRGCYERALLKDPSLAGKAVLEWTISTSGSVVSARTKSSSLRSSAVEGCILRAIKRWRFPPARGGPVIISYPFVFNSVGY